MLSQYPKLSRIGRECDPRPIDYRDGIYGGKYVGWMSSNART